MKVRHALPVLVAAAFSAGASAQNLKPGLWEVTNNMKMSGGEMEKGRAEAMQQMANMPPEQRRKMEEMMAKQGIKTGAAGPGGMSMKVCMTKDMAERNEMPVQRGDCKHTQQPRSGNSMKMAFTCTNPPASGEGQFTFTGSESYTMKMTINSTVQGKPQTIYMDGAGKWLGSNCGDVKPIQAPPAK